MSRQHGNSNRVKRAGIVAKGFSDALAIIRESLPNPNGFTPKTKLSGGGQVGNITKANPNNSVEVTWKNDPGATQVGTYIYRTETVHAINVPTGQTHVIKQNGKTVATVSPNGMAFHSGDEAAERMAGLDDILYGKPGVPLGQPISAETIQIIYPQALQESARKLMNHVYKPTILERIRDLGYRIWLHAVAIFECFLAAFTGTAIIQYPTHPLVHLILGALLMWMAFAHTGRGRRENGEVKESS